MDTSSFDVFDAHACGITQCFEPRFVLGFLPFHQSQPFAKDFARVLIELA